MGKAVKAVGGIFGLGGGGGSGSGAGDPNMAFFDIEKEVAPFKQKQEALLEASLAQAQAIEPAQADVLRAMGEAAAGRGPSLAETQLKQAQDRNLAQQLAAVQAQRGGSAAASQRALLQSMGQSGRELAQQAAVERLAERDRFLQQATQAGQVARADIGTGVDLATMAKREKQKAELARAEADFKRTQARKGVQNQIMGRFLGAGAQALASSDERTKNIDGEKSTLKEKNKAHRDKIGAFLSALAEKKDKKDLTELEKGAGQLFDTLFGNTSTKKSGEKKADSQETARSFVDVLLGNKIGQPGPTSTVAQMENIATQTPTPSAEQIMGAFQAPAPGSVMPAGASAAPAFQPTIVNPGMIYGGGSDKDMKKSKKEPDVRNKFEDFLSKLKSKSYTYKNPEAPGQSPGPKFGVLAQDLEKSEVGRTMVKDTPYGKMVDIADGFGAVLASQAELNKRLKNLEKKGKK